MLQSEYNDFANIEETMQTALNDKQIRMQCEARERYERDKNSAYGLGEKEEREKGIRNFIVRFKAFNFSKKEILSHLMYIYNLSEAEANKKLEAYW